MKIRVTWSGGPLDGCADHLDEVLAWWWGPDLSDPYHKVVIYQRHEQEDGRPQYRFDQEKTNEMNALLARQRN